MTNVEFAVMCDDARRLAKRIIKKMDMDEAMPTNPLARKAMEQALELISIEVPVKDRLAAIRTILEYNMAKPAATSNVNIKSAEDFLDEISSE